MFYMYQLYDEPALDVKDFSSQVVLKCAGHISMTPGIMDALLSVLCGSACSEFWYVYNPLQIEYCSARDLHSVPGIDAEQLATAL